MRKSVIIVFAALILCSTHAISTAAQITMPSEVASNQTTDPESAYTLKKSDNEFGFWGGVSFKATTIFGGLHTDEAADRKSVILALRYGRTLAANNSVALQYTLDAIPLAVETGNIKSVTTVGTTTTFIRDTAYGVGVTPLGLQLDFRNGSQVHPFLHVNGGGLIFNESVPLPDAGHFAFVGEAGTGVRVFTSERRAVTLGIRFHHISNGGRFGSNRGLNQFVVYAGFSLFK